MVSNKLKTINAYPAVTNYWTPLNDIDDDEPVLTKEELNIIKSQTPTPTLNKWTRQLEWRQERKRQKKEKCIIIDSGATSHFVSENLDLRRTGPSNITVYLPDDSTLTATGQHTSRSNNSQHKRGKQIYCRVSPSPLSV